MGVTQAGTHGRMGAAPKLAAAGDAEVSPLRPFGCAPLVAGLYCRKEQSVGSDIAQDPDRLADTIDQGRALVRAIEALGVIEPTAWFGRAIGSLRLPAHKRRLRAIIGTAPAWMGKRILEASDRIPAPEVTLFGYN